MNDRIQRLRQQSLDAVPCISTERAELLTQFYEDELGPASSPVERAMAFHFLLANKTIYIGEGELIVGEKGPAPKATPTYPELCCHSLQDLDILDSREKIPFKVSEEARRVYKETIIPFWRGRAMRDLILHEMTAEWCRAYKAGIFTEFMEQRSPGHTTLDGKIYMKGMLDFKADIEAALSALDFINDPEAYDKQEQLRAMDITADALILFAHRHADLADELAAEESSAQRRAELEQIAAVCHHVPAHAPRTLREALQYYWFVHLGVTTELNPWDAFNPGRLDQHLEPFYTKEITAGTLTRDEAQELLSCFWIKFNNQPAPPKVGVTAEESSTYTDFAQINTGGLRVDGSDAVNEVTYLLLDVIEEMRLLQPSSSVQLSKKNPERIIRRAARIIRTGFGQPSIFNADVVVQEMVRQGKTLADARNGGTSGCVETGAFGKENYNLTGYFNLPKILELALNDGRDPLTGKQLGPHTGDPRTFESYEALFAAYTMQLNHFIEIKIRGNQVIERLY
ncbi:MAG: pyruvate formate lyase family protein, partial [Candidatus Promineifilaceae bacterium]